MSLAAPRAMLRHSTFAIRRAGIRNASSTSEVAGAAKEKSAQIQSKASEGLSRVSSSAGSVISKVGSTAAGALGKVGGRTGRLIGRVQSIIPPTVYYSKVAFELGRLVFQQRKMSLPDLATFQGHLQPFFTRLVKNPTSIFSQAAEAGNSAAAQPVNMLNRIRNLNAQQWASAGVVAAEVVGFFSVGEMIGRMKVVGYRSNSPATH